MEHKKEVSIRFTSLFLAALTTISLSGCNINKDKSNELSTTTQATTIDNSNIDQNDTIEQTINDITKTTTTKETDYKENYEELNKQFNQNISKYSTKTQSYLKEMFKIMLNSNDDVYDLLSVYGYPTKAKILKDKIVEPVKNIDSIRIVEENDKDYCEMEEYCGGTACYNNDDNKICLMNPSYEDFNYQALGEEIIHSAQRKFAQSKIGEPQFYIFAEGEANAISCNNLNNFIDNSSTFRFTDKNNENNIYYNWGVGNYRYSINTKYYISLITLLGYDTVEDYTNKMDDKIITNKLTELYKIDGVKYFDDMKAVVYDAQNDITNESADIFLNNEKTYYKCLEKQIDSVNSKEQIIQLMNIYRYMNIQYGFEYKESDKDYNETIKTKNKLDNSAIENKLYNKLEKYNIFDNLTNDDNVKKQVFNSIINPVKNQDEKNLPIDLTKVRFDYSNNELIMYTNTNTVFTNTKSRVVKATNKIDLNNGNYIFANENQKVKS